MGNQKDTLEAINPRSIPMTHFVQLSPAELQVVWEILEFHRDDADDVPYDRALFWRLLEDKLAPAVTAMQEAVYSGDEAGNVAVYQMVGGKLTRRDLNPRLDLRDHSPTGFAWGYSGSGPAQLALGLAADVVGDERALKVYQDLKDQIIAPLEQGKPFELKRAWIVLQIEEIEHLHAGQGRLE